MDLLSNIPVWVYYVILLITFVGAHVLAFAPNDSGRNAGLRGAMRIGSSLLLLVGLVLIQPAEPGSILLAILAAALGGFVSGRAAPPVRRARPTSAGDEAPTAEPEPAADSAATVGAEDRPDA